MKSKTILVATQQLHGGTEKTGRAQLLAGDELTAEKRKKLGLDAKGVEELVAKGVLLETKARTVDAGETSDDRELRAASDRADKAEQDLAQANATIAELTTKLESATAAAGDSVTDKATIAELEKKLAEATKPKPAA